MKIGLTFNVRSESDPSHFEATNRDDAQEEFDSPETIEVLADALRGLGHDVELLGDGEPLIRRLLDGPRPDLILNIAEGIGGSRTREARVPAVLEMLGVPYTGSDPLALSVALDKDCAKRLVSAAGVATPRWALYAGCFADIERQVSALPLPVVVKPAYEGSSKGIRTTSLVERREELPAALARLYADYGQPILVEEFISGDELTVGLLGQGEPDVLGVMRVLPRQPNGRFMYSLEVKRNWREMVRYESPARLSTADSNAVRAAALSAWRALGCRDLARIDFRLRDGVPYFLECNPLPGLSRETGDLVILARGVGVEYDELIARIVRTAAERIEADFAFATKSRSDP